MRCCFEGIGGGVGVMVVYGERFVFSVVVSGMELFVCISILWERGFVDNFSVFARF